MTLIGQCRDAFRISLPTSLIVSRTNRFITELKYSESATTRCAICYFRFNVFVKLCKFIFCFHIILYVCLLNYFIYFVCQFLYEYKICVNVENFTRVQKFVCI